MDILMLVDRLEAVINGGFRPPLGNKVMIDEREALDVIDLMRTAIPEEIKQSRRVNQERERLIAQAQDDASRLLEQAQERIELMVSQDAVVQAADERAAQIEHGAFAHAEDIRRGADEYAYDVLRELESRLQQVAVEVRNGLAALTEPTDALHNGASTPETDLSTHERPDPSREVMFSRE